MGFSDDPDQQPILFGLFLSMYLVTVLGNLLIILAVSSDIHLHTPMYFFLSNLSLADICFISTTVPKMIVDISTQSRVISYVYCLTQMSLLILFASMDDILLTVMAYDRFVAICHPLHYAELSHCAVWLSAWDNQGSKDPASPVMVLLPLLPSLLPKMKNFVSKRTLLSEQDT
ncbi:Olfactory receptor 7E24 [Heterocephalus glaber]|uniref:Olfactory receptor 7E24 n=1 Tax=Heterocephalus glaber TaxID=10181 RepID=G5B8N0_HETGA|nr:Olfactory receptor 7E24 [Heterocephalus glaber]